MMKKAGEDVRYLNSYLIDLAYAANTPEKATFANAIVRNMLNYEGMFRFFDERPIPISDPLKIMALYDVHDAADDLLDQIAKMVYGDEWFKADKRSDLLVRFFVYLIDFARKLGSLEHARYVDYAITHGCDLPFDHRFTEDVTNFLSEVCNLRDCLVSEIEQMKQEHLAEENKKGAK